MQVGQSKQFYTLSRKVRGFESLSAHAVVRQIDLTKPLKLLYPNWQRKLIQVQSSVGSNPTRSTVFPFSPAPAVVF